MRSRSHGLRVPRGSVAANSVVTVLPTMTAPASRKAATVAASRPERQPAKIGDPISVGMSSVSMMSLMPTGMPSTSDSGLPSRQRAVERSAAARAPSRLKLTKAPILGSSSAMRARQASRYSRGVWRPAAKPALWAMKGRRVGLGVAALRAVMVASPRA